MYKLIKPEKSERDFKYAVGFIGGGCMAESLVKGLLNAKADDAEGFIISDVNESRLMLFKSLGCHTTLDNSEVVKNSRRIVLAVKPQYAIEVLQEIKAFFGKEQLLISICAGIKLETLENTLKSGSHVIRVMPNTCAIVHASASCYALGEHADDEDVSSCQKIFKCVGIAYKVTENLLDAVTGLSGSGPAYVFMMIEAMSDGGVRMGIPRDISLILAAQTVFGSAKMILELNTHPAELKNKVESPGGTTITATNSLEENNFRYSIINAIKLATEKSQSLGDLK